MKKNFKKVMSLLICALMLFAFVPGTLAANLTATITVFNADGTSDGILQDGITTAIFTDKCYYTFYNYDTYDANDATRISSYELSENLDRVATFSEEGSGMEFDFGSAKTVKRLDLWMLNVGGIKDYKVEAYIGGKWEPLTAEDAAFKVASTGITANYTGADEKTHEKIRASYYPVILDSAVTTQKIKFTIVSFQDDENKVAYISETMVRDTNEENLGRQNVHSNQYGRGAYSPYIAGYGASASYDNNKNVQTSHSSFGSSGSGKMIGGYTSAKWSSLFFPGEDAANPDEGIWYATGFDYSFVKVNKIGLSLADGTVTEFEVWATETPGIYDKYWTANPEIPTKRNPEDWVKLATIPCNLTKTESTVTFELPNAIEANGYLVKITKYAEGTKLQYLNLYALSDSELTPFFSDAALTGTVAENEEVEFSIFSFNNNVPEAAVFFALYSGEKLVDVSKKPCALSGIDTFGAKYKVPSEMGDNLSVRAMLWNGRTLLPLLENPLTK